MALEVASDDIHDAVLSRVAGAVHKTGISKKLKSELRFQLIESLQREARQRTRGRGDAGSVDAPIPATAPPALADKAIFSLILELLRSKEKLYSLSVLLPECGMSTGDVLSDEEIAHILSLQRVPLFASCCKSPEEQAVAKPLLERLLEALAAMREPLRSTQGVQTDGGGIGQDLESKLRACESPMEEALARDRRSVEERMLAFQARCEARCRKEMEAELARVRTLERERIAIEEAAKSRADVQEVILRAEREAREREQKLRAKEAAALERLRARELELEKKALQWRAEAQKSLEDGTHNHLLRTRKVEIAEERCATQTRALEKQALELTAREGRLAEQQAVLKAELDVKMNCFKAEIEASVAEEREQIRQRELALEREAVRREQEKERILALEQRVATAEIAANEAQDALKLSENRVASKNRELEDNRRQLGIMTDASQQGQLASDRLRAEVDALQREIETLRSQRGVMQQAEDSRHQAAVKAQASSDARALALEQDNSRLQSELTQLRDNLHRTRVERDEVEERVRKSLERAWEAERNGLHSEAERLRRGCAELVSEEQVLQSELRVAKEQLTKVRRECEELRWRMTSEIDAMRRQRDEQIMHKTVVAKEPSTPRASEEWLAAVRQLEEELLHSPVLASPARGVVCKPRRTASEQARLLEETRQLESQIGAFARRAAPRLPNFADELRDSGGSCPWQSDEFQERIADLGAQDPLAAVDSASPWPLGDPVSELARWAPTQRYQPYDRRGSSAAPISEATQARIDAESKRSPEDDDDDVPLPSVEVPILPQHGGPESTPGVTKLQHATSAPVPATPPPAKSSVAPAIAKASAVAKAVGSLPIAAPAQTTSAPNGDTSATHTVPISAKSHGGYPVAAKASPVADGPARAEQASSVSPAAAESQAATAEESPAAASPVPVPATCAVAVPSDDESSAPASHPPAKANSVPVTVAGTPASTAIVSAPVVKVASAVTPSSQGSPSVAPATASAVKAVAVAKVTGTPVAVKAVVAKASLPGASTPSPVAVTVAKATVAQVVKAAPAAVVTTVPSADRDSSSPVEAGTKDPEAMPLTKAQSSESVGGQESPSPPQAAVAVAEVNAESEKTLTTGQQSQAASDASISKASAPSPPPEVQSAPVTAAASVAKATPEVTAASAAVKVATGTPVTVGAVVAKAAAVTASATVAKAAPVAVAATVAKAATVAVGATVTKATPVVVGATVAKGAPVAKGVAVAVAATVAKAAPAAVATVVSKAAPVPAVATVGKAVPVAVVASAAKAAPAAVATSVAKAAPVVVSGAIAKPGSVAVAAAAVVKAVPGTAGATVAKATSVTVAGAGSQGAAAAKAEPPAPAKASDDMFLDDASVELSPPLQAAPAPSAGPAAIAKSAATDRAAKEKEIADMFGDESSDERPPSEISGSSPAAALGGLTSTTRVQKAATAVEMFGIESSDESPTAAGQAAYCPTTSLSSARKTSAEDTAAKQRAVADMFGDESSEDAGQGRDKAPAASAAAKPGTAAAADALAVDSCESLEAGSDVQPFGAMSVASSASRSVQPAPASASAAAAGSAPASKPGAVVSAGERPSMEQSSSDLSLPSLPMCTEVPAQGVTSPPRGDRSEGEVSAGPADAPKAGAAQSGRSSPASARDSPASDKRAARSPKSASPASARSRASDEPSAAQADSPKSAAAPSGGASPASLRSASSVAGAGAASAGAQENAGEPDAPASSGAAKEEDVGDRWQKAIEERLAQKRASAASSSAAAAAATAAQKQPVDETLGDDSESQFSVQQSEGGSDDDDAWG
eukprot:TRINITY_DN15382_c0_g3_i1.p1 TRINITY_DN15382_c0_g3~~TRINITY_DN15382_c0_g3_i1.p1  ORF type:complete len:1808 (+),score=339.24 TRINITY_DN15382_c0_g3_i1:48-5426(+)